MATVRTHLPGYLSRAGAQSPPPGYRSMLAYWLGGACSYPLLPVPPEPIPVPPLPAPPALVAEGLPFAKHGRYPIDDEEIFEFLQIWSLWNDVE